MRTKEDSYWGRLGGLGGALRDVRRQRERRPAWKFEGKALEGTETISAGLLKAR